MVQRGRCVHVPALGWSKAPQVGKGEVTWWWHSSFACLEESVFSLKAPGIEEGTGSFLKKYLIRVSKYQLYQLFGAVVKRQLLDNLSETNKRKFKEAASSYFQGNV